MTEFRNVSRGQSVRFRRGKKQRLEVGTFHYWIKNGQASVLDKSRKEVHSWEVYTMDTVPAQITHPDHHDH